MLTEKSLTEFLDLLAAKKSVPGGGGAAALTGALSAALTAMVCNFTINKKGYEEVNNDMELILAKAETLRKELATLINLDAKVFDEFMEAYRMPQITETDKSERKAAIQAKAKNAASVPMAVARLSVKTSELALSALQKGNRELASDAVLAGILGHAAVRSSFYNVVINLKLIEDSVYVENMKQELLSLLTKSAQFEQAIVALSDSMFTV